MKVLVVGAGGREHAIVRALMRSPQRPELLCAPGNAGIAQDARLLDVAADDVIGLTRAAEAENVDLVVVGPEAPLVAGLVDACTSSAIPTFGPSEAAAKLEGSKTFAKEAMLEASVPTARFQVVGSVKEGMKAAVALGNPGVVVKADGLAAGKGVTVADDAGQAQAALEEIFEEQRFGGAGAMALIEERLSGPELSLLALCDGVRALPMAPARDYKRIRDGDIGPNTGGMGSFSPVQGVDDAYAAEIVASVHQPIVDLMRERGTPFHGVLYAGLMLTAEGPKVLEFNVRFGDPETQAVLPRLSSDLLTVLHAATRLGGLEDVSLRWRAECAVTVVLASAGYPESSSKGDPISGLDAAAAGAEQASGAQGTADAVVEITHAGTARTDAGIVTAGGRVLNVTALGAEVRSARAAAYAAAHMISFEGMQMRGDIAADTPDGAPSMDD